MSKLGDAKKKVDQITRSWREVFVALDETMPPLAAMAQKKPPKGPPRGDSPYNLRNERGSKQSCFVRAAELAGFGGIVAVTVGSALYGRYTR